MLCCAVLCCAVLCCAVLCCAVLCCAVLYYAMLPVVVCTLLLRAKPIALVFVALFHYQHVFFHLSHGTLLREPCLIQV